MKRLITLLLVSVSMTSNGQNIEDNSISVVSNNQDTLYLVNDSVGYIIEEVWCEYYEDEKPVIIMKPEDWIVSENIRRNGGSVAIKPKQQ